MQISVPSVEAAWQFFADGQFREASSAAHAVLSRQPDSVAALSCAAVADWELGADIVAALGLLERAVTLAPDNGPLRHNLATLAASRGDMALASTQFEAALAIRNDDTRAFYGLAQNTRFVQETDLVRQMLALYGAGTLGRADREFLCFGLAKVYADLGNRARAMHFCIEANWLADRKYDAAGARAHMDAIRAVAEREGFAPARGHQPGAAPVFIVGMPRSGTTLVETILSRHSQVATLGETSRIFDLDYELTNGRPEQLVAVPRDRLRAAADLSLKEMRAGITSQVSTVTDKTPENAFRVGLIAALFPDARIIYMRRHPLDTGLSNLFVRFAAGQGFAFRQTDLGERIRQNAEVMSIWKAKLTIPVLDVSYELLVADPEAQSRRLLAFLNLPWDPACLAPEAATRQVNTASQWQVRQKIHQQSVGRFRGYEEWLEPLIGALGGYDWIETEFAEQIAASEA